MLKKSITYDDYNGESQTEDFYFNFTKLELLELDVKFEGGLEGHIKKLTSTESGKDAYFLFKDVVLSAYGVKSADGKHFEKSQALRRPVRVLASLVRADLRLPDRILGRVLSSWRPVFLRSWLLRQRLLLHRKSDQPELPLPSCSEVPDSGGGS